MKHPVKLLLGLLVSAVCLWLVLRNVQLAKVFEEIRNAKPVWFLPAFLALLVEHESAQPAVENNFVVTETGCRCRSSPLILCSVFS